MNTRSLVVGSALLLSALGCHDDSGSPTAPAPATPQAMVAAVTALAFWQLSGGQNHTCGVTTDYRAYCWGSNIYGQLGDGTKTFHPRPVAVLGGLRFREVSAGNLHTCAVTTDNRAFCWGWNSHGQVGDGTKTNRLRPVAVAGTPQFRQVSAGRQQTCGLTTDNRAYCWGTNEWGQLGDGTTSDRLRPVAVTGGHAFRLVRTGGFHTCGVTTSYAAFCWGSNKSGQLGDSTNVSQRLRPSRVAGTRQFRQLDVGGRHTCAVTTSDRAFCWGNGREGELGNGKTYLSFWPRAVSGGFSFTRVTAGSVHTCGESTTKRAYCWGQNYDGQLGDGTAFVTRLSPVPVVGGLTFSQLSAGSDHTCGKTPTALAYCWGRDTEGQLGTGTWGDPVLVPTAVLGPL